MATTLSTILNELQEVRKYLIKIGPSRRIEPIVTKKRLEADEIYCRFNACLDTVTTQLQKCSKEEIKLIDLTSSQFIQLYEEIINLCTVSKQVEKMSGDNFDLKTALSLLPILNDEEIVTKQLIESLDYYSSTITEQENQLKLIPFVLKTRLSPKAKLKLKPKYDKISDLIRDMRLFLLPQKSHTALQSRLHQCQQNDKSVEDYGKELTELFVELTISQAQGNTESYNILRPLNEKTAIKRFADGLRNRRLSTIIAARNFDSLSDAIQAAQEENVSGFSGAAEISSMGRSRTFMNQGYNGPQRRPFRGRGRSMNRRFQAYGGRNRGYQAYPRSQVTFHDSKPSRGNQYRGNQYRGNRGMYGHSSNFNRNTGRQINCVEQENDGENEVSDVSETLNHFFRP